MSNNKGLVNKYFVLKPAGNNPYAEASRKAMKTYAIVISSINPKLSNDIYDWIRREERKTNVL